MAPSPLQVSAASKVPIQWDIVDNIKDKLTPEAVASLQKTGVGMKGQFKTGIGRGSLPSVNIEMRKALGLYANIVSAVSIPGVRSGSTAIRMSVLRWSVYTDLYSVCRLALPSRERRHRRDS